VTVLPHQLFTVDSIIKMKKVRLKRSFAIYPVPTVRKEKGEGGGTM
jgi:hypothetical protein